MKKGIGILLVAVLLVIVGLFVTDIVRTNQAARQLNELQIQIRQIDKGNEVEVAISVTGEVPHENTEITVFADNRFLELQPDRLKSEEDIFYEGPNAGGAEAIFTFLPNFDGELTLYYYVKEKEDAAPLIYAFIESTLDRYMLSDTVMRTKMFQ